MEGGRLRERIIETASQLIGRHGLRRFTLDDLAAQLGISKKTIYKYFSGKDDIISVFFDEVLGSDRTSTLQEMDKAKEWRDRFRAAVFSYHKYKLPLPVIEEARQVYPREWEKVEAYRRFKVRLLTDLLNGAVRQGLLRPTIRPEILIFMIEKTSSIIYEHQFLHDHGLTLKQAWEEVYQVLMKGICE
ncbi:MAG: TetR/AcrR family transcriptional regulator [Paenibacillus macerans]|uniref:TetR family transcriptional regulator n=2 Tax=Paenibacillus macerans TaxID=44252 RepID=A0A6N8EMS6_PAEMA|nr:TetR/AcrR family transcriptional regulator [Paenibacillus macerans]MCY7559066.1 TetR/AcrR family transcriptional regulator [Paenibacillus macerans]MDU5946009.1 TetR/AcrR family transcriptional regulator [Paenibacillus macerans]MDU7472091.1 TetR/AcrR family transcriptional regulator [Paenibacillus macerans]MEC0136337.1 TetR/AcrR family transcriptional regulator [Paenibacillus macerans]MEC0154169.1 TetR/AcrR family transcriptional regulator [Paenibacillus macerans]